MQVHDDVIGLARICAMSARLAETEDVARTLWEIANEYREKAMAAGSGDLIDIGPPPAGLSE
jgi:hypothetical protein